MRESSRPEPPRVPSPYHPSLTGKGLGELDQQYHSDSENAVPRHSALPSPGILLKMQTGWG